MKPNFRVLGQPSSSDLKDLVKALKSATETDIFGRYQVDWNDFTVAQMG